MSTSEGNTTDYLESGKMSRLGLDSPRKHTHQIVVIVVVKNSTPPFPPPSPNFIADVEIGATKMLAIPVLTFAIVGQLSLGWPWVDVITACVFTGTGPMRTLEMSIV